MIPSENLIFFQTYSVLTIIENLNEHDSLSIVQFESKSTVAFPHQKMTEANKTEAKRILNTFRASGGTNMWEGIKKGLETLQSSVGISGQNATLLFLTDGEPSDSNHVKNIQDYKDKNALNCTINTFGFGYSLNSVLLKDLAHEGNGTFAFIPDSSLVGTVFVNALTNILCAATVNATLSIEHQGDAKIECFLGGHKANNTSWGSTVQIGALQFGQTKDYVIKISGKIESPYLRATLKYRDPKYGQEVVVEADGIDRLSDDPQTEIQILRSKFLDSCGQALVLTDLDQSRKVLNELIKEIECSTVAQDSFVVDLLQDLTGQITEAFSKKEWFQKWGRHFLPSIIDAHKEQQCNNFKDFGVQHYGGELFKELRDKIDEVFITLPPPKPTQTKSSYSSHSSSSSYSSPSYSAPQSMNVYYNQGGG